jgi:hypothetical protein
MNDYSINVTAIEEYQNVKNLGELERIFDRAKSAVVNGVKVLLVRKEKNGKANKFDELDTLEELEEYRKQVFKYL